MFDTDPAALDADATLGDVVAARAVAEVAEVRILSERSPLGRPARPAGRHRRGHRRGVVAGDGALVCLGGDGTPQVAELAAAEFDAVLGLSNTSASMLVGDALDLRHRAAQVVGPDPGR